MADGSVIIDTKLNQDGIKSGLNKIGSIAKIGLKSMAVAVGAVAGAFAGVVKASVQARGEMEQVAGGAKKIFDEMDYSKIEKDAQEAYKTMNLSATEYLDMMNSVGATFASTMGDEKGYNTAKKGMQAIADYASGTGANIGNLNEKYKMITRSTTSYLSIADQFSGLLPQTTDGFLKQAQASGFLSNEYKKLNDVPVAEYQQAISAMLEQGVKNMGLYGNTLAETENTLTGSLNALKASWNNFLSGSGNLSQVVVVATDVVKNITRIVGEAIPDIINGLTEALPEMLELGKNLLGQLMQGIMDNFPKIVETTIQIIQTLMDGLLQNLPRIIEAGIQVIAQLIRGIAQMLPALIPQVVDCIIVIVETLIDNLDMIIDVGIDLIIALIEGIFDALPNLIMKLPELITKIAIKLIQLIVTKIPQVAIRLVQALIDGLFRYWGKMLSKIQEFFKGTIFEGFINKVTDMGKAGLNLIKGLWEGIKNAGGWIRDKVANFAKGILDGMKRALGIHSPSKLFKDEVGKYIALGVGEGFTDNIKNIYKQMKTAVDFETQKLSTNLSTTANVGKILTANISVEPSDIYMDSTKVGRAVTPAVSKTLRGAGAY